jgi:DNA-binding MarR family transcriptional regulator
MTDRLDRILEKRVASRPDLDFSPFALVTRVLRAAHFLQVRLDRIAAAYGLSHQGDLEVLTELDLVGPLTPSELAEGLLLTTGGMTVRLNRLQAAGLLSRQPNPEDGRGVLIHLTPQGREVAEDALATLLQAQAGMVGGLEASDRDRLTGLLRAFLIGLGDVPAFSPAIVAKRGKQ